MFSMLRILRGSPGRVHTMPHADLVASICIGIVSASAFLSCLSTYAAPSTRLRNFRPCSNSLSLIEMPPVYCSRSVERGGRDKKNYRFFIRWTLQWRAGNPPQSGADSEEETVRRSTHE